jgi:hypothetical protein
VTTVPGGPLLLRGDLHVTGPNGIGTCVGWPHPRRSEP